MCDPHCYMDLRLWYNLPRISSECTLSII